MAKKTRAELKEDLKAAKEELKVAKSEKRDFEKSNKLEKDTDHSGHEKFGKKWTKMNDVVTKKQAAVDKLQTEVDEAKAEGVARPVKYDYPADVTTALEKKKFRASARAAKAKAEKGETPKKEKKVKESTETAIAGEGKSKKSKKEKKAYGSALYGAED